MSDINPPGRDLPEVTSDVGGSWSRSTSARDARSTHPTPRTLWAGRLVRPAAQQACSGSRPCCSFFVALMVLFPGLLADGTGPARWPVDATCRTRCCRRAAEYWFGTDQLGCDVYSLTIFGARPSVVGGRDRGRRHHAHRRGRRAGRRVLRRLGRLGAVADHRHLLRRCP